MTDNIDGILDGTSTTALQNLARRYRHFSIVGLALAFLPFTWVNILPVSGGWRVALAVYATAYFLLVSLIDRWLYRGLSAIDCATMPVDEVARLALYYRKRHLQSVALLLPMVALWVGAIIYFTSGDVAFIVAVCVGMLVGLAIGLRELMAFMSDYRRLTR